ncbi:hypothetical protein V1514DRAFT_341933 [Lipomyces japonicus]|uniref:uncharacterized protein n=1 Tax=Lipomyces japonicus TaxID=56871 RepID=UPI0034CE1842
MGIPVRDSTGEYASPSIVAPAPVPPSFGRDLQMPDRSSMHALAAFDLTSKNRVQFESLPHRYFHQLQPEQDHEQNLPVHQVDFNHELELDHDNLELEPLGRTYVARQYRLGPRQPPQPQPQPQPQPVSLPPSLSQPARRDRPTMTTRALATTFRPDSGGESWSSLRFQPDHDQLRLASNRDGQQQASQAQLASATAVNRALCDCVHRLRELRDAGYAVSEDEHGVELCEMRGGFDDYNDDDDLFSVVGLQDWIQHEGDDDRTGDEGHVAFVLPSFDQQRHGNMSSSNHDPHDVIHGFSNMMEQIRRIGRQHDSQLQHEQQEFMSAIADYTRVLLLRRLRPRRQQPVGGSRLDWDGYYSSSIRLRRNNANTDYGLIASDDDDDDDGDDDLLCRQEIMRDRRLLITLARHELGILNSQVGILSR